MYLVCPTYNRFAECVELINSANSGTLKPTHTYILDNSGKGAFLEYLKENQVQVENVTVIYNPMNYGCARGWNLLLKVCYDRNPDEWVCVANDDIKLYPDALELFDKATESNDIIYCAGGIASPNAFSLFVTRYDILKDNVGLFDEMFLYPYCEDGDKYLDLRRIGKDLTRIEGVSADHIGSATLKAFDEDETMQHHAWFARNAEYFYLKHGIDHNSIHTKKPYDQPFNGDETSKHLVISYIRSKYGA